MADEIVNADVVIGDVLNVTVDNVSETVTVTQTTSQEILNATIVPGTKGDPGDPGPAGADAPSDHTLLTNIGTNTHAQIDTAISNSVSHIANTSNPHGVTKAQVGLSNVPNTDFTAAVAANTAARHTHANKTLLDTYSQTEVNLADAIAKKHTHANSAVLDATTASFTTADETKLDGIAAGAQVNTVTSVNTRTGAVTGLAEASDVTTALAGKVDKVATANRVYTTNDTGVQSSLNYSLSATPGTFPLRDWTTGTIITATPTATTHATTKAYVDAADAAHTGNTSNPHSVTKAQVGLGNADNTSDVNKPISTATQTALDGKVDKTGDVMTGSLTATTLTAGTATDVLGTALSVIRNNVAVGRIDNNASGLRIQAQNGTLQLRGTGNTGIAIDASGNAVVAGTITPVQATTAGAPAYVKGAIYFDTTLNKLRVGGASGWETVTSA